MKRSPKRTTIEDGVEVIRLIYHKREHIDALEADWRESLHPDAQVGDNCNNAVSVERIGDRLEVVTDILDDGIGRKLIVDFKSR